MFANYLPLILIAIHTIRSTLAVNTTTESMDNHNKTTAEDEYVVCDQKRIGNRLVTTTREHLCKVECYTAQNRPGLCQVWALNPCKTMHITDIDGPNVVKCKLNQKGVKFESICCPFKRETPEPTKAPVITPTPTPQTTTANNSVTKFGISAQPNTWPWIVSVYERPSPTSVPRFLCGGAIINERYVLSAAHCFVRYGPGGGAGVGNVRANRFLIKFGGHRLSDPKIPFREVAAIIPHKDYNAVQHYHDIALIKLRHKIEFMPTVGPICLPRGQLFANRGEFVGNASKLVGWGATRFGGVVSDELREVDVNILDRKSCHRNYTQLSGHQIGFPNGINGQLMCAGVIGGGKDSCQGDSGGPLALAIDGKWYELGIVSFGYKCAEPGYPGIYTRVQNFMNWIQMNIK
ncbi:unnamed protein product [Medioppia subpectinata]|uniref:Peptidase S1 domain-containing protein n=1 Tax=Medioppia subpectinata TaxID=1979941 RepID=A0A7R9PZK6_9ACAR|nr:unnamed protein product [Medioppia subpectinata]CAG2106276.1 unnamed protein product [Medioppia subpectinata]